MKQLKELNESIEHYKKAITRYKKKLIENKEKDSPEWVIENNIDMIKSFKSHLLKAQNDYNTLNSELELLFKHFKKDIKPITKGKLYNMLKVQTRYNNDNKVYSRSELIDKMINENLNIGFTPLIINNLNVKYNHVLGVWL